MADDITVSEGPEELEPMSDSSGGLSGGTSGSGKSSGNKGSSQAASTLGKKVKPMNSDDEEDGMEEEKQQFEECDVVTCKYYNEEGFCSYETCRISVEDPVAAAMVTKICQFCGEKFTVNMNEMLIQVCPACLKLALLTEGHPHKCVFCEKSIEENPSPFMPICTKCFKKLLLITTGDLGCIELAANDAWC